MTEVDANKLSPKALYEAFIKNKVESFYGVPDSTLSAFGHFLEANARQAHYIAVNEGNATALAIGYHLATSKVPLVYLQNSGLGNAINPLISLADPMIMGIPMILLIGWRGQPGNIDEPQHQKQGLITMGLLDALGIEHLILSPNAPEASRQVNHAANYTRKSERPFALVVASNTFEPHKKINNADNNYQLCREDAIGLIAESLSESDIVVATTGKTGRELFEYRDRAKQTHKKDMLIVGGMGHASSIAASIALQKPNRKVYCIDGDGALLMHMGSLSLIGSRKVKNIYHIVINNGAHESVGGQPTVGFEIDIPAIAKDCGYSQAYSVDKPNSVRDILRSIRKIDGPVLVEIRVNSASRSNLGRPTIHPKQNKESFMEFLDRS